ncbi:MAG: SagB/ThcOx family dehydrogenase, partial [Calditrichia bacterium]
KMRFFGSAKTYHEHTKYNFDQVKSLYQEHLNEPRPSAIKEYPDKESVVLPKPATFKELSLPDVYSRSRKFADFSSLENTPVALQELSNLLYLTNGVTDVREFPSRKIYLRAAPSASGLYSTDIYVAAIRVNDLSTGIHYFNANNHQLLKIAEKNAADSLRPAAFDLSCMDAPVILILTSNFLRNEWKFRERAYRYCLMDAGYVVQNLMVAAAALGLSVNLIGDFRDDDVNKLLQLNESGEACLLMAALGKRSGEPAQQQYRFSMHPQEDDYISAGESGLNQAIHQKSKHYAAHEKPVSVEVHLPFHKKPEAWQGGGEETELPEPEQQPEKPAWQVIENRRSTHHFLRAPIKPGELSFLLNSLKQVPLLYNYPAVRAIVVIHEVEGVENGIYGFVPESNRLSLIKRGTFRGDISYLTLAQDAVFNCSAAVFFAVDFNQINLFSNRGYRYAHIDVGMLSECLYLSAGALGLGARGIGNFFDDSINSFFNLSPEENVLGGVIIGRS